MDQSRSIVNSDDENESNMIRSNQRLDIIAQEQIFTNSLHFVSILQ
jgi:hypothetical protein